MKSFRRSRSMYLRAASPSLDDRDDDILNDFVVSPPNRRCGMHLLESIHKLKCNTGSASKGVTLMSQSENSGDPRESHHSTSRRTPVPLLDPLTVDPSLQIHQGLEQNFVTFQYPSRRREDDASDDALTAPRRFSSPSHCRAVKEKEPLLMDPVVPVRGPVVSTPPLCDIPECVVIPRMKLKMDGRHDDDDEASGYVDYDSNDGCSRFQPKYFDDIPKRCESISAPTYEFVAEHDDRTMLHPDHFENDDHDTTTRDGYHQEPWQVISDDSHVSREFSVCSEGVPVAQRTFFLASTTEETTKMSSLSRKVPEHRRSVSLQASDHSFATTKSGATLATSHSTSTGISRSSGKTLELIRRFERHSLQRGGHAMVNGKGTLKLPALK